MAGSLHLVRIMRGLINIAGQALRNPRRFLARLSAQGGTDQAYAPYLLYRDALPGVVPLNFALDPALAATPTLNVLLPGMAMRAMSGGPNTAINLVYRLAAHGIRLRFISTDIGMDKEHGPLRRHFASLTGLPDDLPNVEIVCGFDRSKPLMIGRNDVFFASAWWNVQMIKRGLTLTAPQRFIYIVQDFEPSLYAWSARHALALETYGLDFHAIICGRFLANYLFDSRIGRFGDAAFRNSCAIFEPAVDRTKFYPETTAPAKVKRLLFYARPTSAERNLFELGLHALRQATLSGVFSDEPWELLFIGEAIPPVDLGRGVTIRPAPWLDYDKYAALMRSADIVLSLMLSPHSSYPPIEAAAAGAIAVTNTFANKTQDALAKVSPNIIGVPATLEGIVAGLGSAVVQSRVQRPQRGLVNVPDRWEDSFSETIPQFLSMIENCRTTGEGR